MRGRRMAVWNMGHQPRQELIARFEEVYAAHCRDVWAIAYARTLDRHAALDIAQEAYLRLWQAWCRDEKVRDVLAWLRTVARRLASDRMRSSFQRNGTLPPEVLADVGSRWPAPPEQVLAGEVRALVRRELKSLPDTDREILTLRYALGYTAPAIAQVLEISVAAVHMRLMRARQKLGQKLIHLLHGEESSHATG